MESRFKSHIEEYVQAVPDLSKATLFDVRRSLEGKWPNVTFRDHLQEIREWTMDAIHYRLSQMTPSSSESQSSESQSSESQSSEKSEKSENSQSESENSSTHNDMKKRNQNLPRYQLHPSVIEFTYPRLASHQTYTYNEALKSIFSFLKNQKLLITLPNRKCWILFNHEMIACHTLLLGNSGSLPNLDFYQGKPAMLNNLFLKWISRAIKWKSKV